MTRKQQRNGTRRAAPVLTWVLLTAATVAALTVRACALWLPDRAPSVLSAPSVAESAPASVQEYSGTQQVNVVHTYTGTLDLLVNPTGNVTENWAIGQLRSGSRAYQVYDGWYRPLPACRSTQSHFR